MIGAVHPFFTLYLHHITMIGIYEDEASVTFDGIDMDDCC